MIGLVFIGIGVFWASYFCGEVVDDKNARKHFDSMIHRWNNKDHKTIWFYQDMIRALFYGAGLFRNIKYDHLLSAGIHILNACLIYKASGVWLAAMLWLINPVNHQMSLWLNGRRYAVSLTLVLLAWIWWPVAPIAFLLAACIHVSAVFMPVLFLSASAWPMALVGVFVMYFIGKTWMIKTALLRRSDYSPSNQSLYIKPKKIILYIKSVGHHVFQCIFPVVPSMYNNFLKDFGYTTEDTKRGYSFNFDFWRGLICLSGLIYLIVNGSFWAFWFLLFISQWCNIWQVTMCASDRYSSIASVGIMVLLAQAIERIPSPWDAMFTGGIVILYLVKYMPLFRAYSNVMDFHRYHIYHDPECIQSPFFLADLQHVNKDLFSAFSTVKTALRYNPDNFKLRLKMFVIVWGLGNYPKAMEELDKASQNVPIGEEEFFRKYKEHHQSEYEKWQSSLPVKRYIHNNGKPIVN